ncbi:hypothetical protein B0H12DRAFT_104759 [Mycena haematopus]|nr:hypothetical protein B0H12DRAFT_104759 [Mycena haematopus]
MLERGLGDARLILIRLPNIASDSDTNDLGTRSLISSTDSSAVINQTIATKRIGLTVHAISIQNAVVRLTVLPAISLVLNPRLRTLIWQLHRTSRSLSQPSHTRSLCGKLMALPQFSLHRASHYGPSHCIWGRRHFPQSSPWLPTTYVVAVAGGPQYHSNTGLNLPPSPWNRMRFQDVNLNHTKIH